MQRTQRKLHRLLWLVIAPALAAAIIISLRNRPEFPVEPTTPHSQQR